MFGGLLKFFKRDKVNGGVLQLLAIESPAQTLNRIKIAKNQGYDGVEVVCRGLPGKMSPEDQADTLERIYLKTVGMSVYHAHYEPYKAVLKIRFK